MAIDSLLSKDFGFVVNVGDDVNHANIPAGGIFYLSWLTAAAHDRASLQQLLEVAIPRGNK